MYAGTLWASKYQLWKSPFLKTPEVTEQLELACIATLSSPCTLLTFGVTTYTEVGFNACLLYLSKYINSINSYITMPVQETLTQFSK